MQACNTEWQSAMPALCASMIKRIDTTELRQHRTSHATRVITWHGAWEPSCLGMLPLQLGWPPLRRWYPHS